MRVARADNQQSRQPRATSGDLSQGATVGAPSQGAGPGGLSHLDERGRARMVDVGGKPVSERFAAAEASVRMAPETLAVIEDQAAPKGDVIAAARLAGIMAAKRTHELIPLCHPLALTFVGVEIAGDSSLPGLHIRAEVRVTGKTGAEMEALTAATVAALTVYDMCKAIDRGMEVDRVRLVEKRGGKSGVWRRAEEDR